MENLRLLPNPGRYRLSGWEMAPPEEKGYTQMVREFALTEVTVGDQDVDGVEIHINRANQSRLEEGRPS